MSPRATAMLQGWAFDGTALLLASCLVPPAIMLFGRRGAPLASAAEALHAVDAVSPRA